MDIETKTERAMIDLLRDNLDGYRRPRAWDGSAPAPGDVVIKAEVQGQVEDGRARGVLVGNDPNEPSGILYEILVEISAYHDRKTKKAAFRSLEDALGYPYEIPGNLTTEELHVQECKFDQPWRKEIEDPLLVRTIPLTIQAGHVC